MESVACIYNVCMYLHAKECCLYRNGVRVQWSLPMSTKCVQPQVQLLVGALNCHALGNSTYKVFTT